MGWDCVGLWGKLSGSFGYWYRSNRCSKAPSKLKLSGEEKSYRFDSRTWSRSMPTQAGLSEATTIQALRFYYAVGIPSKPNLLRSALSLRTSACKQILSLQVPKASMLCHSLDNSYISRHVLALAALHQRIVDPAIHYLPKNKCLSCMGTPLKKMMLALHCLPWGSSKIHVVEQEVKRWVLAYQKRHFPILRCAESWKKAME